MIPRTVAALALCLSFGANGAAPEWTAHASRPGPDYPAAGQSRFDELYRQPDGSYRIPYPFAALVADLERRIDNGAESGVHRVLIPRGRSLQREAPAPDYDRFPREVVALEGEPIASADGPGSVLEYRLFVAHQPFTDTLEIISYNDSAGRFEFQIAADYRAGGEARAEMANRVLCLSCHQNAAPVFPRRPWSETPFNVAVARSLAQHYPPADGSLVGLITTDAGRIDVLSERANYLSAAQIIWQRGCASAACRVAALRAVLQYRLSGKTAFDTERIEFRRDYVGELERGWNSRWPHGLALADSRIDDRDPFAKHFDVSLDPLTLRAPHAVWRGADAVLTSGILQRLAGFFSADDIHRLDRRLGELSAARESRRMTANCLPGNRSASAVVFECGSDGQPFLQARLEIPLANGEPADIELLSLRMPGTSTLLQPQTDRPQKSATGIAATLRQADSQLSQRLGNGDRLASLQLVWEGPVGRAPAILELELRAEFEPLDRVLTQMLRANLDGRSDSLSDLPFRRDAILAELMRGLGIPQPRWLAATRQPRPPAPAKPPATLEGELALLYPYCGTCHAAAGRHPPGFLAAGDTLERVSACAPRIWRRLAAWRHPDSMPGAPMPPPATLALSGSDVETWPRSEHYRNLLGAIEALLDRQATNGEWRSAAYASLPACSGGA